ncbi:MAG: DNA repair protein RecO [Candidatus Paceibacterota bacterium]
MSYHIYQTEGFILESRPLGEANKSFLVFTKDLGMVRVSAQGVRLQKSKLRYGLQDFCHSKISLVRGKEVWRITNVSLIDNLHSIFKNDGEKMAVVARIFSLLVRLLHGEEENAGLFNVLSGFMEFFKNQNLTNENKRNAEAIAVLRILNCLGYLGDGGEISEFTKSPYFDAELLSKMSAVRRLAFEEINKSLKESHL